MPTALLTSNPLRWLTVFGPGAIIASLTIGTGELIFPTRGGALFGYRVLFLFVMISLLKWGLVFAVARHMALTGVRPYRRMLDLPGPRGWLPLGLILLASLAVDYSGVGRSQGMGRVVCLRNRRVKSPLDGRTTNVADHTRPTIAFLLLLRVLLIVLAPFAVVASGEAPLVQVHQDFSQDPGWDHYQNRIVGTDMPKVVQDFGWRRTNHTGGGPGEIGGQVENSRRQAYYAMPFGKPLTFDDAISASGKLALRHIGLRGVGYVGFFNSRRHTWRVWSSMAFRIWEEDGLGQVMFDWMSSDWQARGVETAILLKPDGKVHAWSFRYEPDAKADPTWRDKALKRHLTESMQEEAELYERMKKEDPGLTRQELRRRLLTVRDQGLVEYFHRHNLHRWWKRPDGGKGHGRVILRFDDQTPYVIWFDPKIRQAPVEFDRFGLFNIARFGTRVEMYLSDLVVNGQRIDLSQDPHWLGHNNESQYSEPNFHGMHSYGWSQTAWAGKRAGEIGGLFWRTEPPDPLCSYYGDDVGKLTLEDPLSFSGTICFTDGMTDAAAFFGYFNRDNQVETFRTDNADAGFPMRNMMGVAIADSSAVGYYFHPLVSAADREGASTTCGVFTPDGRRRRFSFVYDPKENRGVGQVTVTLDGKEHRFNVTPEQRKAGAVFTRFGLANVRRGGHSVEFYLDDLIYTARREGKPRFIPQTTVEAPYPHKQAGRRY